MSGCSLVAVVVAASAVASRGHSPLLSLFLQSAQLRTQHQFLGVPSARGRVAGREARRRRTTVKGERTSASAGVWCAAAVEVADAASGRLSASQAGTIVSREYK
uniref:Uncharacterized protein n=1 Tax=Oryza glumipatula TaxID=40148 RepID=A0A0D9YTZ7_9ORYZ